MNLIDSEYPLGSAFDALTTTIETTRLATQSMKVAADVLESAAELPSNLGKDALSSMSLFNENQVDDSSFDKVMDIAESNGTLGSLDQRLDAATRLSQTRKRTGDQTQGYGLNNEQAVFVSRLSEITGKTLGWGAEDALRELRAWKNTPKGSTPEGAQFKSFDDAAKFIQAWDNLPTDYDMRKQEITLSSNHKSQKQYKDAHNNIIMPMY